MMIAPALTVTFVLGGALDVSAPPGCVDPVEVSAALDEIGGIDIAETVHITVTPRMDEYALVVDIALAGAPPLHRDVPLRPRECQDVADLVAVLVQSQRRAALEAKLLADLEASKPHMGPDGAPLPKPALPAMDPRTRPAAQMMSDEPVMFDGWSPCDGPMPCGGFRLGVALGGAFPLGARASVDTGWDVNESTTAIVQGEALTGDQFARAGGSAGVAWRTLVVDRVVEVSVRGLIGFGGGNSAAKDKALAPVECVVDESGNAVGSQLAPSRITTWYLAPTIGVRARIGYAYAEAGTFWHVNLDDTPSAYLAVGFAPFGT